jgi:hypothetical protein
LLRHFIKKNADKKILDLTAVYATDPHLLRFLGEVKSFYMTEFFVVVIL